MADVSYPKAPRALGTPSPYRPTTVTERRSDNLADILERVLDKGIVIAGDITVSLATVELLSIKIRLLIASVDKAREIGINWWQHDPALTGEAATKAPAEDNARLQERLDRIERQLTQLVPPAHAEPARGRERDAPAARPARRKRST
jgi:hypothetical protein